MKKETAGVIVSVMTALISGVIVEAMPNLVLRIIFIIGVGLTLALYLLRQKIRWQWKDIAIGVVGTITVLVFVISIAVGGSDHLLQQLQGFLGIGEETQEAEAQQVIAMQEAEIAELNEEINTLLAQAQGYENLEQQMDSLEKELSAFSDGLSEYQFWSGMEDQQEAEAIYEEIVKQVENDEGNNNFLEQKDDKRQVELFYKMRLSRKEYHYCNVITALEMYGIDCEEMSIDEYQLILWDIEILFATYSMHKSTYEMEKDITYELVELRYNDYKINMSEYSDTFDYGDYRKIYKNVTADEVEEILNDTIMNFYKKLNMNFNTKLE